MTKKFKVYSKIVDGIESSFTFVPGSSLPAGIAISTPMNFVYVGGEILLTLDKSNFWNAVCGKIENDETWQEALRRETLEEVGAEVGELYVVGYLDCRNGPGSKFKPHTILPVCYSYSTSVITNWVPRETKNREFFSYSDAVKVFSQRDDASQIMEILEHITSIIKISEISLVYEYVPDKLLENVPVTSAMTFCYDDQLKFCVVRDIGEDFLSLPGGHCSINEKPDECALRELNEEAQIIPKNNKLLGTILVSVFKDGKLVSKVQQARYYCYVDKLQEFKIDNNKYETDMRVFMDLDEMADSVRQLRNKEGKIIISHLKKKLKI